MPGTAELFLSPPESSKPWVFWYWMYDGVSREGITADLEAMNRAGIGGAYLMSIKGPADPPLWEPPVEQLTPEWWDMVLFAIQEADRLGLKIAMHLCDGFAVAGGPWITPGLSMQKITWSEIYVSGGRHLDRFLPQPEIQENYYRDIAVFALPVPEDAEYTSQHSNVKVTTDIPGAYAQFLVFPDNEKVFRSEKPCRIRFEFDKPFMGRSVIIRTQGNNYQSYRFILEASDNGKDFRKIYSFDPPRHGWQDDDANVTFAIPPTKAKYFQFVYNREGSEPGAEDLDAAKWKQSLKITGIELAGAPRIHQFEGKTGAVWRISNHTTQEQVPDGLCVPPDQILDISSFMDTSGHLTWEVPEGQWLILRMGHTSTGHTNATGGAGKGLECDKFNPEAVKIQFDHWFGEALRRAGPELAGKVLNTLHVDSWECGSQNWSAVFRDGFRQKRGYDLYPYLPAMAGIPVGSAARSEEFLHDIRQTIIELTTENFFGTLSRLSANAGCTFSAENVAPTFTSDGMLHFGNVDIPMGEFWLRSPTHDKRNDILDAVSGAHIYGKQLIQAEAFTQIRMAWDEYPAMLKPLADYNFSLGINRLVFHVFTHNPWTGRKPGMTLDGIGLYFQRDQTWWEPGRAWMEYIQRCQALLQLGQPVNDIAVFTGEEIPRRALLPEKLVPALPGIFGPGIVDRESIRMANKGLPVIEMPDGVWHSANMADHFDWTDPLNGYSYDSFNPDALLNLATVSDGNIVLPGGANYKLLVIPGNWPESPGLSERLISLADDGATILLCGDPQSAGSVIKDPEEKMIDPWSVTYWETGKGRIVAGPWTLPSFEVLGIESDLMAFGPDEKRADKIAWTHRTDKNFDIYFISNQVNTRRMISLSLRTSGLVPEIYDPVSGQIYSVAEWKSDGGRIRINLILESYGALFVVFNDKKYTHADKVFPMKDPVALTTIAGPWLVQFNKEHGGPSDPVLFEQLEDWTNNENDKIRYYSGTASYSNSFGFDTGSVKLKNIWLDLGKTACIAEVELNGNPCGVAWTQPYRIEITGALQQGQNKLVVRVTNTWINRLIGDHNLPEQDCITWTIAPYRLEGKPLLESGLAGPVKIIQYSY